MIDACDECPTNPGRVVATECGCGDVVDSDGDRTPDCVDFCPNDPLKVAPGVCGCGVPDGDDDGDGTPNCRDDCPADPAKTTPGVCGCGTPDGDSDADGYCNGGADGNGHAHRHHRAGAAGLSARGAAQKALEPRGIHARRGRTLALRQSWARLPSFNRILMFA